MRRSSWVVMVLLMLSGLGLANPTQNAAPLPTLDAFATTIRAELESHGERILGKEMYHWSTRLEGMQDCRAAFSVRLVNNFSDSTVQVERVSFLLGALDPYGIELQQNHRLQLPCFDGRSCIFSTSTCTRKSKDGIVIDCSTPNQKRAEVFSVQLDGDSGAADRLQQALRRAIDACRQPSPVTF